MEDKKQMNLERIKKYIEEHQIKNIKLAVVDIDGVLRGKYVNTKKFFLAVDKGLAFCEVIFGWDSDDVLYGKDSFTGWKKGFGDSVGTIDTASFKAVQEDS